MQVRTVVTGAVAILAIIVIGMNISSMNSQITPVTISSVEETVEKAQVTVSGSSMEPTLKDGDVLFADVSEEAVNNLKSGDIIILHEPGQSDPDQYLVKRIVGVEGDIVEFRYGKLYVNDMYHKYGVGYPNDFGPYTVKEDSVFVLGDNLDISMDSRAFMNPSLSLDLVVGRIIIGE